MNTPPRIGILGAGQLALMLAEAGRTLNVDIVCAGRPGDCASQVAQVIAVDLESPEEVRAFHDSVDVLTIESENVETSVLAELPRLAPQAQAIRIAQDRLFEKDFLRFNGVATAPYAEVNSLRDLHSALATIGAPPSSKPAVSATMVAVRFVSPTSTKPPQPGPTPAALRASSKAW